MNFRKLRSRSRRNSLSCVVNAEKWRNYPKRISRRDNTFIEEDSMSDDDELNSSEVKDWAEEFFGRNSIIEEKSEQDLEVYLTRKQTLILSTLVPDEILLLRKFDETAEPKRFVGVLLMADVSGFTALSERYNNTGKGGTYRLTETLNTYLGSLIEVIYSHGGDIIKFAGDAFLALWKTDKRTFLNHTIHSVIVCGLIIQQSFGSYETDVKVNLKVKLAISAGNLMFSSIGTGIDMNYIITGLPVLEAKIAESLCESGEVKLTPTAWGHCYSRNYDHFVHNTGHVTVKSILYDPREKDVSKPFPGFGNMIRQIKKPFICIDNLSELLLEPTKIKTGTGILKRNEVLNLRKTILLAEERNIGFQIRKFMIRPVLTQIDAHQPLEYLTEMRQVSILFITLKSRQCPSPQLITIVNNSYQITCEIVYKSMGCVNKIILFDKDIMILVVFGLRGFKHESEAQAALKCAYAVKKSVSALDGVLEVSIGVTTGQVYCGVIGHPLRREFTVIGAIVNKAARFMCNFRDKITCDEATFIKSKMSGNGFTLQPKKELKGIAHPGRIYEYTEEIRVKELYDIPMITPLLNRNDEMEYFENWIDDCYLSFRDFDTLLLIGESRIGKSKLLEWMARYAKNKKLRTCYLNITSIHSATPYLALTQIINQILEIKEPILGFTKEEKIVSLMKSYDTDLCHLNNIIKVRFAYHEAIYSQDDKIREEKAKSVFLKLVMSVTDTHVIFLDDLQNLDSSSWEYISIMLNLPKFFTVLTVSRGKFSSVHSWLYNVFINNNTRKIVLGRLTPNWISALACQILDVNAVPNDLCEALKKKCKGIPGLIESFIMQLFSSGALEIKTISRNDIDIWQDKNLQFPDTVFLRPQALNTEDQETLDKLISDNSSNDISICLVTKKEELNIDINTQNIDALIMIQIDSLTPYQQLLLKIASVIGDVLSRNLLENIMYENNTITTAKAIKRLFAMRILSCANVRYRLSRRITSNVPMMSNTSHTNLLCECSFEYDSEENENLPKYAFCKVMKFRNRNSRKTCYELLPINQKKEFHSRIVTYLENNKQKCPTCGGTIMFVQSLTQIHESESYESVHNSFEKNHHNNERYQSSDELDEELEVNSIDISNDSSFKNSRNSTDIRQARSEDITGQSSYSNCDIRIVTSETKMSNLNSIKNKELSIIDLKRRPTTILKTCNKSKENEFGKRRRSIKRVTMSSLLYKRSNMETAEFCHLFDMVRAVTEANKISDWHNLGVIDSSDDIDDNSKKHFKLKIENNISKTDFKKCSCSELNIIINEQLIHHAKEADLKAKVVEFLIRYSYFNFIANNFNYALPKLDEAEEICNEKHVEHMTNFNKRRFLGKIYTLRAAVLLMCSHLAAAKINIERAIRIYHLNLNSLSDFFNMINLFSASKIKGKKYFKHDMLLKSDSIFCLNVASLFYSALGDEKISRISALRALNLVQKVECNVVDLCDVFSNAMQVEMDRGNSDLTENVERIANLTFRKLPRSIQADEMYAIGKFFMSSFRARIARGKLVDAIRSGFRSLVITRFLHADNIAIEIIPDLVYILLSRRRIEESIDVLKLSQQLLQSQSTIECETWYYALCIDLILDAGFELESPFEISYYAEHALHKGESAGPSRRRLVVGLWTYWLRLGSERRAKRFESEALNWTAHEKDDGSLNTLISALRLAEGMLECLASKMDDLRKVVDLMELRSLADKELTRLEKDARLLRAIYPRWILLKAYSHSLSGRQNAAAAAFNHALEEARGMHNHLEESLARAVTSNSPFWIQSGRNGHFIKWHEGCKHARKSWHQIQYKITTTRK